MLLAVAQGATAPRRRPPDPGWRAAGRRRRDSGDGGLGRGRRALGRDPDPDPAAGLATKPG